MTRCLSRSIPNLVKSRFFVYKSWYASLWMIILVPVCTLLSWRPSETPTCDLWLTCGTIKPIPCKGCQNDHLRNFLKNNRYVVEINIATYLQSSTFINHPCACSRFRQGIQRFHSTLIRLQIFPELSSVKFPSDRYAHMNMPILEQTDQSEYYLSSSARTKRGLYHL